MNTNTVDLGGRKHINNSSTAEASLLALKKRAGVFCVRCHYFISMFVLMQLVRMNAFQSQGQSQIKIKTYI